MHKLEIFNVQDF